MFALGTSTAGDAWKLQFPPGTIVMWTQTQAPAGWAVCDGTNGTPDMRGRFVRGGAAAGIKAGSDAQQISIAHMPTHRHEDFASAIPMWQGSRSSSNVDRTGGSAVGIERGGSEPSIYDFNADFSESGFTDLAAWYRRPGVIQETFQAAWGIPLVTLPSYYTVVFIMKLSSSTRTATGSALVASSTWDGDVDGLVDFPDGLVLMHAGATKPASAHWELVDQLKNRMPRGAGPAHEVLVKSAPETLKWSEVAAYVAANYPAGWRLPTKSEAQAYLARTGPLGSGEHWIPVSDVANDYVSAGAVGARFGDLYSSLFLSTAAAFAGSSSQYKDMLLLMRTAGALGDAGGGDTARVKKEHYPKHSHVVRDDSYAAILPPRVRTTDGGAKGGDDFGGYMNTDDPNHVTYGFKQTISMTADGTQDLASTDSLNDLQNPTSSDAWMGQLMNTLPAYAAVDFYRKRSSTVEGAAGDVLMCCDASTGDGDISGLSFPVGMIVMWFPQAPDDGSVAPSGWRIYTEMNDRFPRGNGTATQAWGGGEDDALVPAVHHQHERQGVYSLAFQFNWYTDGDSGSPWKSEGNRTLHVAPMGGSARLPVVPAYITVIFLIKI